MTDPGVATEDTERWHKRFGVQCNNRTWELSVRDRTPDEDREMLDMAHACAWHWSHVGTELNRMRATMLLAEVHAALGMGDTAMVYADTVRRYFLGSTGTPDWELACMHAVHAHAAHAAGRGDEHRDAYARAKAALAAIADEEDRQIIAKTFERVPAP
jgi:hypothetical protein